MIKRAIPLALSFVLSVFIFAGPALAHHSFQAEFDGSKVVYLTGTLTRFEWVNPHMYFYVDVKDADGKVTPWTIEGESPNVAKRTGTQREDFVDNVGKTVTVRACPAKNGTARASAETIKMADGRELVVGGKRYTGDGGKTEEP